MSATYEWSVDLSVVYTHPLTTAPFAATKNAYHIIMLQGYTCLFFFGLFNQNRFSQTT